jgi:hypothetical protein
MGSKGSAHCPFFHWGSSLSRPSRFAVRLPAQPRQFRASRERCQHGQFTRGQNAFAVVESVDTMESGETIVQHAYKTSDLAPEERVAVERLIGRTLQSDEAVEVIIHKLDELRREQETARRRSAAARIRELAKGKNLDGVTVRQLIEE